MIFTKINFIPPCRLGFCLIVFMLAFNTQTEAESKITIASVQYPIEGNQTKELFFKKIESYVAKAAKDSADLVLFPEWITLDIWPLGEGKKAPEILEMISSKITNEYFAHLQKLSKNYNMIIAGGTTAKKIGKKTYNVSPFVFPDGRIIEQKKVYLTKWEKDNALSAGNQIEVIETKWGKMAVLICYDVEFPDISKDLAKEEIDLFLVPSMTESPKGENRVRWTSQARAIEHTSYVVISPTVGKPTPNWKHFGRSAFITPQLPGFSGTQAEGKNEASGVWVESLDLAKLKKAKQESSWRPARQMRNR